MRIALASVLVLAPLVAQPRPVETSLNALFAQCSPERATALDTVTVVQTLGIVRRTPALDARGMFALVHPVAACCPKGVAVGLLVRHRAVGDLADGTKLRVRGALAPLETAPPLPKGHLARAALGVLRRHVAIAAATVEVYDALADKSRPDLVAALRGPSYATFVRALRQTGWLEILAQPSYFTVLAPTEHAFARLTEAERTALFRPENAEHLQALVRRHVVTDRRTRADLVSVRSLRTAGGDVPLETRNGRVRIGGARVLFESAAPRNGVILALDRLVPKPTAPRGAEERERPR